MIFFAALNSLFHCHFFIHYSLNILPHYYVSYSIDISITREGLFHIQNMLYLIVFHEFIRHQISMFNTTLYFYGSFKSLLNNRHKIYRILKRHFSLVHSKNCYSVYKSHVQPFAIMFKKKQKHFWFYFSTYRTSFIYTKISNKLQSKRDLHPQYKTDAYIDGVGQIEPFQLGIFHTKGFLPLLVLSAGYYSSSKAHQSSLKAHLCS